MKTALIVDDSRLARTVLRTTLAENGISVDEAPSAEAAIEYLQFDRPDVIFLDHMMPGMDGFEALDAIKANPKTATIPVMMYTSQDGQFYVSQARALGAVDVLPKSLKPADVKRVLSLHHLINDADSSPEIAPTPPPPGLNKQEISEIVRSLVYEQTETLLTEIREELKRTSFETLETEVPVTSLPSSPASSPLVTRVSMIMSVLALATAATFGALYFNASRVLTDVNHRLSTLSGMAGGDFGVNDVRPEAEQRRHSRIADFFDSPVWSRYQTQHFAFDAIPLDDARAIEYGSLFAQLKTASFSGTIVIDVHEGRYCMRTTAEGKFELAPPNQLAVACDQIGTPTAMLAGTNQSVVFANMVAVATRDGQLSVETVSHADTSPIVEYPILDYSVTAGYWNSVAALNQRISLHAQEDDSDFRDGRTSAIYLPNYLN